VYKVGKKGEESHKAGTDFDVVDKEITPLGGFPHYGERVLMCSDPSTLGVPP
jgi:hypothetical protein